MTIVLHLGHLVHKPWGISRFFDLPRSFGFLAKVVALPVAGGGVTAGSVVSNPRDFLVNDEVAIPGIIFKFPAQLSRHKLRLRPRPAKPWRKRCWWLRWSRHHPPAQSVRH